jgi:hypothetical protein
MIESFRAVVEQEGLRQLGKFMHFFKQIQHTDEIIHLASSIYKIKPPKSEMDRFVEVYDYI